MSTGNVSKGKMLWRLLETILNASSHSRTYGNCKAVASNS